VSLDGVLGKATSGWNAGSGPEKDLVVSTRVRLARNLAGVPFPHLLAVDGLERVMSEAAKAAEAINDEAATRRLASYPLVDMDELDRRVLVEKHLVSPGHISDPRGRSVILGDDESASIMVNEEDHLRIQYLLPGLQLEEAWVAASQLDDSFEKHMCYAFSELRGYLTCCPTNVGTGLRASVMLHLPALVMTEAIGRVLGAINKLGLVVRGMYGEGTQASGNLFQVSNQVTLGQSEEEVIRSLLGVTSQVIAQERHTRQTLVKDAWVQVADRVGRAYGILTNAHVISSEEAIRLWSDVRLGVDLGLLTGPSGPTLNEMIVATRASFLQRRAGTPLEPLQRDVVRAEIIRELLARG
jgi:protein arginine kinase